jgi:hypothetical protein
VSIKADGRLGIARVIVRPEENKVWVDYALRDDQLTRPDMATSLLVFGLKGTPTVEFNEKALTPSTQVIDGQTAYVIPLDGKANASLALRYQKAQAAAATIAKNPDAANAVIQDWWVTGPFPNEKGLAGFEVAYGPEQEYSKAGINLKSTYKGMGDKDVTWQHINAGKLPAPGVVDFNSRFQPNAEVTAYAYTKIVSDRDRIATLLTGSDDTITVWINGKQVLANKVLRGAAMDDDRSTVHLKKGENTVLVKVGQGGGGWGFFFRLGDEFGSPITDGLTYGAS